MAKYTGTILTNKGKELLARAILGEVIVFTKVEIGKGIVSPGTNKENLTTLVDSFKILSITSTSKLPNGGYRIRISFNNKGFIDDTYLREVGVFARGEDGTEVLYSYCNTDTPNLIPNEPSGIIESVEDIITYISSAATINAVIDQSNVYATIKDLVEGLATKENIFNKNGAFNKPFGTILGTVMEGNKRAIDLGGEAAFAKKTAFNRSFSHVISSTSKVLVASAYAVKIAYDKGAAALSKATTAQNTANSAQTKANEAYSLASEKEPKFNKGSAFNKNYGTGSNDIPRGNHNHSLDNLVGCPHGVGDYWITESTSNPATKWTGTTWTKLEGRVLLGTSNGYALGTQGGRSTVALTLANIAAHTHGFSGTTNTTGNHYHQGGNHRHKVDNHAHTQPGHTHSITGGYGYGSSRAQTKTMSDNSTRTSYTNSAGGENTGGASPYTNYQNPNTSTTGNHNHTISGTTRSSGSGSAFNIMNPYRVVNIWRRTA